MTIEVTDADVEAVEAIIAKSKSDRASNSWECVDPKEIIAAAWAVMRKKQADTLADAVKEAIESGCFVSIERLLSGGAMIEVSMMDVERRILVNKERTILLGEHFATIATAAVRQLSQEVRQ